jgi:hypothetical protein
MSESFFLLLIALLTKHLIVDFPLQAFPYQYKNKGTYGHPGGLLHASLHLLGTFLVLVFFVSPIIAIILAAADGVIHYHIDWTKVNINAKTGWGPTTSEQFWWLLGLDQYCHMLTYVWILWMLS